MKKLLILAALTCLIITGCNSDKIQQQKPKSSKDAVQYLLERNDDYVKTGKNTGDISQQMRADTAQNGQKPYAVVITCSDSRVPAEHIFGAGVGDLFVIRTAGNVIGEYELGSVEYGAEHLGCKLVLVLGHTGCGAVEATLSGGGHGAVKAITDEIARGLQEGVDAREAEKQNVKHSIDRIMQSDTMKELTSEHGVEVKGAIYDIEKGTVEML